MSDRKRAGTPPYVEVYDRIRALMERDGLGPGEPLANETVLAGELSVSRELVVEALLLLEEDGHLRRDRDRRWCVPRRPDRPVSSVDPFPLVLGDAVTAERRVHSALETGGTWAQEMLDSPGPFVVWETLFALDGVLLASTLEVLRADAAPEGFEAIDPDDVEAAPTLLDLVPDDRRGRWSTQAWRLSAVSRHTERLAWMDLPMHGIPVAYTLVLTEDDVPVYLAKNIFDLGTFSLAADRHTAVVGGPGDPA